MTTVQHSLLNVGCVKAATSIIGDKWTPLLLRHISNEGQIRFCRIQELVDNINPRTLSARLTFLEQRGVIIKTIDKDSIRHQYSLTKKGKDLLPILRDMQIWGEEYETLCSSDNSQVEDIQ